jgi:hypothetical protein
MTENSLTRGKRKADVFNHGFVRHRVFRNKDSKTQETQPGLSRFFWYLCGIPSSRVWANTPLELESHDLLLENMVSMVGQGI